MSSRSIIYPIVAVLAFFGFRFLVNPGCQAAPERMKASLVRSDLRTFATAIESYYVDHEVYPDWTTDAGEGIQDRTLAAPAADGLLVPSIRLRTDQGKLMGGLTTPIAYMTSYYADPFTPSKGHTYAYWRQESREGVGLRTIGWIAWSPGPDGDYDLHLMNVEEAYDNTQRVPSDFLYTITYDPTNGLTSNGDIYRTKQ